MAASRKIRILIVDDSAVMRSLLRSVIMADSGLEVAGTAADGETALGVLESLHPDLILLDVEMPVMDGLVTLRKLRAQGHKMPVIMCSSLTQRGAKVTLEALACGASDYVAKPAGQASREAAIKTLSQDLFSKIRALSIQQQQQSFLGGARPPLCPPVAPPLTTQAISSIPAALAIGVSTGGPAALEILLPALPQGFALPVLIVQHMPELFTKLFAERLNGRCRLPVHEAGEGEPVRPGTIYIAKGNWHMEVLAAAHINCPATLRVAQGPLENHCRPAVDVLFRSMAAVYGAGVLAVVLTGMGSDGMKGCHAVRERGGCVLAQDQATSTVWGMPGAVAQAGLAHKVLPLDAIAGEIVRLAGRAAAPPAQRCNLAHNLERTVV
jgi:two-component system chemotaxis response regulator CheB